MIREARENRSTRHRDDPKDLVHLDSSIYQSIIDTIDQKRKTICINLPLYLIAYSGRILFLLKKSAILKRKKVDQKRYEADYSVFDREEFKESERWDPVAQNSSSIY